MNYKFEEKITSTPDFPKKDINFKDWSPLLADAYSFKDMVDAADRVCPTPKNGYAGISSRGYILASALAYRNRKGMVMIAKANKLPPPVHHEEYSLEYGTDALEMKGPVVPGDEIVIVDDLTATAGTAVAAIQMAQKAGYNVVGYLTFMYLKGFDGKKKVEDLGVPFYSIVDYDEK